MGQACSGGPSNVSKAGAMEQMTVLRGFSETHRVGTEKGWASCVWNGISFLLDIKGKDYPKCWSP